MFSLAFQLVKGKRCRNRLLLQAAGEGIGQLDRGGGCVIRLLGIDSFDVALRSSKYSM
jgi:hypothetical protein